MLVTHEQDEAFDLGDRVAVLRSGRLEQVGTPDELYAAPANPFVGGFVGRSSVVPVTVLGPRRGGPGSRWRVSSGRSSARRATRWCSPARRCCWCGPKRFGCGDDPQAIAGRVTYPTIHRTLVLFTVVTDGGATIEVVAPPAAVQPGERVGIMPSRRAGGGLHLFPADGA